MLERYRMYRRGGVYYSKDKVTGQTESLKTRDKVAAKHLIVARNQAVEQPQLNRSLAKAYLAGKSPELLTRTWADVIHHYVVTGVELASRSIQTLRLSLIGRTGPQNGPVLR